MGGGFGGEHAGGEPWQGSAAPGGIGGAHLSGLGATRSTAPALAATTMETTALAAITMDAAALAELHRRHLRLLPGYDDYGYDNFGDYANDGACFQYRHVHTAAGWRWRQVWICN